MNKKTFEVLQFDHIKEEMANYALTDEAKQKLLELWPSTNSKTIRTLLDELSEAMQILNKSASVPVHGLNGIEMLLKNLNTGAPLKISQFIKLNDFLDNCGKMRRFMKDKAYIAPRVSEYISAVEDLPFLTAEIQRCISYGRIDDYATKELLKIRKQISIQEERIKEKVQNMLRSGKLKNFLQEQIVSQRDGRYVFPIKKAYRSKIKGSVLDTSASGSTLFIEPEEIAAVQEELNWLKADEDIEVTKIRFYLTGLVEEHEPQIKLATETMIHYDFLFAKAKYCRSIDANYVEVNEKHRIDLKEARHPLLGEKVVPLNLKLGDGDSALVITGPNTGGKTVALKTVGLLTLMAQSGLHLPVAPGSTINIYEKILVDIGDGQSIIENLSTFSSRIINIIDILKASNDKTLALLDELGSGTDPGEGMGLATAILEQLCQKGTTILATTHYSEIKEFADNTDGFINGSMAFDLETLKPTYRLIIGKGGESQAFKIALKLGLHPKLIECAHQITYKEEKKYETTQLDIAQKKELDKQINVNRHHQRNKTLKTDKPAVPVFEMGDNVEISPEGRFGIVYKGPDNLGNYVVQIQGEKVTINHKRLTLKIPASDLYPEDYDFDIVFKSKTYRKNAKLISKGHHPSITLFDEE